MHNRYFLLAFYSEKSEKLKAFVSLSGRRFYLLANTNKYTVGRAQQNDLCLSDDTSVSREHAMIYRSSTGIRVEDNGSKYGVYINNGIDRNTGIASKTPVDLQAGNIVRFGRMENTFRLENIAVNVCTSTMSPEDTNKLKECLKVIDGTLQQVWKTECTHLVMKNVTITVKVLQSLAFGLPIVSPNFFEAYIECATQHGSELPEPKKFVPEITEPYIIKEPGMMEVHLDRQRLFQNKTFVFMVKRHMVQYEPIITLAAGKCIHMEGSKFKKSLLLKPEYIPVQYQSTANSQNASDVSGVAEYVESHDRRFVNDSEIGLAIIHRAIDRFCNPDRRMVTDFQPVSVDTKDILKNVIIGETPHSSNTDKPAFHSLVIPETIEINDSEPNNNLRSSEAIDLDKPSTPRRSTRNSMRVASNEEAPVAPKIPTPKKIKKRKHNEQNKEENHEEELAEHDPLALQKKQKMDEKVESQGESSSSIFAVPMPPQSQSVHSFSGFISTQKNRQKNDISQSLSQAAKPASTPEVTEQSRKRALSMLNAGSDDEQDENGKNHFGFGRKSKRTKTTGNETRRHSDRSILNKFSDDEEEEAGFNFFMKRPSRTKQKRSQKKSTRNENDKIEMESETSFKKFYQQGINTSHIQRISVEDITATLSDVRIGWASLKIKKEMELDESNSNLPSALLKVKVENVNLEESDMDNGKEKRKWMQSMKKAFNIRKIDINQIRRSMIDVTDSLIADSANVSHNQSKQSKKFTKVIANDPWHTISKVILI